MTNENQEPKESALDQLKRLSQGDRISSLDIQEPKLEKFDASNIFEIDEVEKPKKGFAFGKRSQRKATEVKIKTPDFDEKPVEVEDVMETQGLKRTQRYAERPVSDIVHQEQEDVSLPEVEETLEPTQDIQEEIVEETLVSTLVEENVQEEVQETQEVQEVEHLEDLPEQEEYIEEEISQEELVEEEIDEVEEVDDDEDEFMEKKRFLLSQYENMEQYLEMKSNEGYHFLRHEGKKFYFKLSEPKDYYYSVNYFFEEPDADEWREWEKDGWKLISKSKAKSKKEAGWFIFRNEEEQGEYRKEIDNDSSKYKFFKKYSNSCRSTMFLIFICMLCCLVTGFLQYRFQAPMASVAVSGILFVIALIMFGMYGRMLSHAKKTVRKLKANVRLKEREFALNDYQDEEASQETFEELDTDWNQLEEEISKSRKKRRNR